MRLQNSRVGASWPFVAFLVVTNQAIYTRAAQSPEVPFSDQAVLNFCCLFVVCHSVIVAAKVLLVLMLLLLLFCRCCFYCCCLRRCFYWYYFYCCFCLYCCRSCFSCRLSWFFSWRCVHCNCSVKFTIGNFSPLLLPLLPVQGDQQRFLTCNWLITQNMLLKATCYRIFFG